jgi:GntR family transcriptional regulator
MLVSSIREDVAPHAQLAGPLYHQINQLMRKRILSGEWTSARTMPNEAELAQEYGVSLGTMRKALELLTNEGLIVRRQGRGTFVNQNFKPDRPINNLGNHACQGMYPTSLSFQIIPNSFEVSASSELEAGALAISQDDKVVRVSALASFEGGMAALDSYVISYSLVQKLFPAKKIDANSIKQLLTELLANAHRYVDQIKPELPTLEVATVLGLEPDRPLLNIVRIVESEDGRSLLLLQRRTGLFKSSEYVAVHR